MRIRNARTGEIHQTGANGTPEEKELFQDMSALSQQGTAALTITLTPKEVTHFGFTVRQRAQDFLNAFMDHVENYKLTWSFNGETGVFSIFPKAN